MRRFLLLPTATLLCCGFSSFVAAQNSLTVSQAPTPAPHLYLAQDSGSSQSSLGLEEPESSVERPVKESPFSLFSEDTASESLAEEPSAGSDDSADNGASEGTTPVGRRPRGLSPADTVLSGAAALSDNGSNFPPIDWASQQRRAPNHTAEHMLQQWCADGLWDNYAAERAAQCAQQARLIAGKHHCGHCGHAGQMGSACCPPQPICAPRVGRQLGHCGHCGNFGHAKHLRQIGSCDQGGCAACSQCDQAAHSAHHAERPGSQVVASGKGPQHPAQSQFAQSQYSQAQRYSPANHQAQAHNYQQTQASQYAQAPQQVGPNGRPMPSQMLPAQQEEPAAMTYSTPGKVALQPLNFNR